MQKLYFAIPAFIAAFFGFQLGIFLLLLYLQRIEKKSTLYFSLICFCVSWFALSRGMMMVAEGEQILKWSRMEYIGIILYIPSFCLFIDSYLEIGNRRLLISAYLLSAFFLAVSQTDLFIAPAGKLVIRALDLEYNGAAGPLYFPFTIFLFGVSFFGIFKGAKALKHFRESDYQVVSLKSFLVGATITLLLGLNDLPIMLWGIHPTILLAHYGFMIFCLLFSFRIFQRHLTLYRDLKKSYLATITALASAIDARDKYTLGHSERVTRYAVTIAEALNIPEEEKEIIKFASLLHDIGKIGIPDEILLRPSRLSEKEWEIMKNHVSRGIEILSSVDFLTKHREVIASHHERFDGTGYVKGLKGGEISLDAQIIAIADTFDAMTSDRPYRKGFDPEEAFEEIKKCAGTQFDPEIVCALLAIKDSIVKIHREEKGKEAQAQGSDFTSI